jgi:SAM-dependent methyltransferase
MNKKSKKELSREIGLEVGYLCGNYFLKLDHLHYGYWTDDLEVDITNLHTAQDKYANFVISHIPDGTKSILDVGSGTGHIDKMLIDKGYEVDCLSPSTYLNRQISKLLNGKSRIYETTYEEFQAQRQYDLVLFCESFQYLNIEKALSNTHKFLNKDGCMLICDIFKREVDTKGVMGGGHKLTKFNDFIDKTSFRLVESIDITRQTAPNMDLMNDVLQNVVRPIVNAGITLSKSRYRTITRFVRWTCRKKIAKLNHKYFEGGRTGEDFKERKLYQLLLYQKVD